ncbi:aminotransferase class V-fold PLP-dependent enzyme [Pseudomonas sp. N-137]|uniref:aminotransferase class V-fold PLP-dependent enzyme n=1 Tax=Pseudomonas sp. N-137 TaxID=3108452 RepID=UPI002ADEB53E|nr:aminotransferase class V-fold PLP-dependent enzyme [Pseudomonas sp. N-137]MEA1032279.1 aminotransferase class V-fold PLP-dependent enzyme [Pseudomonas sp. N-137]
MGNEDMYRATEKAYRREKFVMPKGLTYLAGNSLGPAVASIADRLVHTSNDQWGQHLAGAWKKNGWLSAPENIGDKISVLLGADQGTTLVCDSTSINLFKLLNAALAVNPQRKVILTDNSNFSTDLYVAKSVGLIHHDVEVRIVPRSSIVDTLDRSIAVLMLSHVDYRSGQAYDMALFNEKARSLGTLTLWDVSHSVGIMALDFNSSGVDMAVGCGYKYLNGGPGAPAFVYVKTDLQNRLSNPIQGWLGHAAPFVFSDDYVPASGIKRLQVGTPTTFSLVALEEGVDLLLEAGIQLVEHDSRELFDTFMAALELHVRKGRVNLLHDVQRSNVSGHIGFKVKDAEALHHSLMAENIVTEYRYPDLLRIAFNPLYTSLDDLQQTAEKLNYLLSRH